MAKVNNADEAKTAVLNEHSDAQIESVDSFENGLGTIEATCYVVHIKGAKPGFSYIVRGDTETNNVFQADDFWNKYRKTRMHGRIIPPYEY